MKNLPGAVAQPNSSYLFSPDVFPAVFQQASLQSFEVFRSKTLEKLQACCCCVAMDAQQQQRPKNVFTVLANGGRPRIEVAATFFLI